MSVEVSITIQEIVIVIIVVGAREYIMTVVIAVVVAVYALGSSHAVVVVIIIIIGVSEPRLVFVAHEGVVRTIHIPERGFMQGVHRVGRVLLLHLISISIPPRIILPHEAIAHVATQRHSIHHAHPHVHIVHIVLVVIGVALASLVLPVRPSPAIITAIVIGIVAKIISPRVITKVVPVLGFGIVSESVFAAGWQFIEMAIVVQYNSFAFGPLIIFFAYLIAIAIDADLYVRLSELDGVSVTVDLNSEIAAN